MDDDSELGCLARTEGQPRRTGKTNLSSGKGDLLDETIAFWQPHSPDRVLTREDAVEIRRNLVGFFKVLMEWAQAEKEKIRGGPD
ncbi:MAG TPA: hypothetical protein VG897_14525 [Terriglobales bacterium]|nr:hypothetical protein [Terriglobales bacterium]